MTVKLRRASFEFGKRMVKAGHFVFDERDAWSEHQPSADDENRFLAEHSWSEYADWHLGIDDEEPPETKGHYKFPYGDFARVHRCGVLTAESRAGQYKYADIQNAATHLDGMIDAARTAAPRTSSTSRR
jgi:hypothetical protein